MEPKKFYTKIDQLAKDWYIDANRPVKGNWATTLHEKGTGPRKRTNQSGEVNEPNESSGEVQIIKWAHEEQFCQNCCKMVKDRVEQINLNNKTVKCNCGLKYPICLDKTMMNSK
jgi:hypothetical protein